LIVYDEKTGRFKESEQYLQMRQLGLALYPFTFRIDKMPNYTKNYDELLDVYVNTLNVDGIFTDFTDMTYKFIENNIFDATKRLKREYANEFETKNYKFSYENYLSPNNYYLLTKFIWLFTFLLFFLILFNTNQRFKYFDKKKPSFFSVNL
jgi:ATP-dependent Zn protease